MPGMNVNNFRPNGEVFINSAAFLWQIAADAANRATLKKKEDPDAFTSDTVTAVMMSVASTEAFINELADILQDNSLYELSKSPLDWNGIGRALQSMGDDHIQPPTKYKLASLLLPGDTLDPGASPLSDFKRLVSLRNDFTHPKALYDTIPPNGGGSAPDLSKGKRPPSYYQWFNQQNMTFNGKTLEFPRLLGWRLQLLTPSVAHWACRSAFQLVWNIIERLANSADVGVMIKYFALKRYWEGLLEGLQE